MDKPSDELCDGDSADDKQLEHEGDHADEIVEDNGFSGSRGHTLHGRNYSHPSIHAQISSMSNAQLNAMLNARHKAQLKKTSDYLCDGDSADDKEIQDTADADDTIVEDFGFSGSRNARGQVRLGFVQVGEKDIKYSDQLANGDRSDDKELEKEHDMTDDIVDENGHTNYGYAHTPYNQVDKPYRFDIAHYADNNIKNLFPEHFGTVPRADFVQVPESDSLVQFSEYHINEDNMNVLFKASRSYSDELANGDSADDKEVEKEHDMTDDIVDENGHTNRGYGHTPYNRLDEPYKFDDAHFANNKVDTLIPGSFGTTPRAD